MMSANVRSPTTLQLASNVHSQPHESWARLVDVLFTPVRIGPLALANRIVMAPMTRKRSTDGVPGPDVAAYYRRRAENSVGLIITEGATIGHPASSNHQHVPRFYGSD